MPFPEVMQYVRMKIEGEAIVVAFDICSSSTIIEALTVKGDMGRFHDFIATMKHFLADAQKTTPFDPYKFTGDGWILLFPKHTRGPLLLTFLETLSQLFFKNFETNVLKYLDIRPSVTGLTFGLDMGPISRLTIFGADEYVGVPLNIACRLQSAVKEDNEPPAYNALVSKRVFHEYFSPATGYRVSDQKRKLRNIHGGNEFECTKIDLLPCAKC